MEADGSGYLDPDLAALCEAFFFSRNPPPGRQDTPSCRGSSRHIPVAQGATHLILEPLDFLRRLAALVSFPYAHATRYHGIFANRSLRRFRPPPPPRREDPVVEGTAPLAPPTSDARATVSAPPPAPPHRLRWAQLLRRLLDVDALACTRCSTRSRPVAMVVLAFLTDPDIVAKILRHLGLPTCPPPLTPTCSSAGQALPDVAPPPTIRPPP